MGVRNYGGQGYESAVELGVSKPVPSTVRMGVKLGLDPISVRTPSEEHRLRIALKQFAVFRTLTLSFVQNVYHDDMVLNHVHPRLFYAFLLLTPLAHLDHFLICELSFSFERSLAGCLLLRSPLVSDGNIIFI
jgi:hypothetical protein